MDNVTIPNDFSILEPNQKGNAFLNLQFVQLQLLESFQKYHICVTFAMHENPLYIALMDS